MLNTTYNFRKVIVPALVALRLVVFVSDVSVVAAARPTFAEAGAVEVYTPQEFLGLTNAVRISFNKPELQLNDQLNQAALAKAEDMASKGYFDHFRPSDNKSPWAFIKEGGYGYSVAGENIAKGYQTPLGITRAWLNSPKHKANLVSEKYEEVGFACIQGVDGEGKVVLLTVQMFGSR